MRLLFAGSPAVALPTLVELAKHHEVVAVLTQPPKPRGRKSAPQPTPVAEYAESMGWQLLTPQTAVDAADTIAQLQPDLAVVVAYGQLLPQQLLQLPRLGWLNLHFSLLPAWRGAAPVQHAIIGGAELTGVTVFQLDAGMDTGPVFAQLPMTVSATDTAGALLDRMAVVGAELVRQVVDSLATGDPQPKAQVGTASYAPKLQTGDACVSWQQPAAVIDRLIRGCTPDPGAWTSLGGAKIALAPIEVLTSADRLPPGQLQIGKNSVIVGTGSTQVMLGEVKPAGRNWMSAAAWARGLANPPECFD